MLPIFSHADEKSPKSHTEQLSSEGNDSSVEEEDSEESASASAQATQILLHHCSKSSLHEERKHSTERKLTVIS